MLTWRDLVESCSKRVGPITAEFLDELEAHFEIPEREMGETEDAVLGNWLTEALGQKKITIEDFDYLRRKLGLENESPEIEVSQEAVFRPDN